MGGIVSSVGGAVSSALSAFGSQKSKRDYYRALAADADYQAQTTAEAAQRQGTYLFKSAAERSRDLYTEYRQTVAAQKTALAASGLVNNSSTVQNILKNTRLSTLLDEETLRSNLNDALYENDLSASQRIRALNTTAEQYRRSAKKSFSPWSVGGTLLSWLNN